MGNSIITGARKKAKIMRIDGETFRFKTPATVDDVTGDFPGHVLLDPEAVKRFGVRAKPLDPNQKLKPRKTYFLMEPPNLQLDPPPYRRVSSAIHVGGAKERLDLLMLSRRSVSEISSTVRSDGGDRPGSVRVKVRLSRTEIEKIMKESSNDTEAAKRIMSLYGKADVISGGDCHTAKETVKARDKHVSFAVKEVGDTASSI